MGVGISIVRTGDWLSPAGFSEESLAGNKSLFRALTWLPSDRAETGEIGDAICRPTDFDIWREFVLGLPNQEIFKDMLDRLEADSTLWLRFDY